MKIFVRNRRGRINLKLHFKILVSLLIFSKHKLYYGMIEEGTTLDERMQTLNKVSWFVTYLWFSQANYNFLYKASMFEVSKVKDTLPHP
jgi:hypothetical protein